MYWEDGRLKRGAMRSGVGLPLQLTLSPCSFMCREGRGVEQSYLDAGRWYTKAAYQVPPNGGGFGVWCTHTNPYQHFGAPEKLLLVLLLLSRLPLLLFLPILLAPFFLLF